MDILTRLGVVRRINVAGTLTRLGGSLIPPGHAAGYPTYRLEWQALGSLQRRIRNCNTGVRAEPWRPGGDEVRALEVFMAWRDQGLAVEAPAVRP